LTNVVIVIVVMIMTVDPRHDALAGLAEEAPYFDSLSASAAT